MKRGMITSALVGAALVACAEWKPVACPLTTIWGERILLHFGAVDFRAQVFIGHPVEGHLWRPAKNSWGYGGTADTKTREGLQKTKKADQ